MVNDMKSTTNTYMISLSVITSLVCGICLGWVMRGRWRRKMPRLIRGSVSSEESFSDNGVGECKLVLVVRNDLKMGKGKMAAQCCHASVLAYRQALEKDPDMLKLWEISGQRKVVVKVDDEQSLFELALHAKGIGLTTSLICDAGRTQIAAGTRTVLGVGPGPDELVDRVTGHLKLL